MFSLAMYCIQKLLAYEEVQSARFPEQFLHVGCACGKCCQVTSKRNLEDMERSSMHGS